MLIMRSSTIGIGCFILLSALAVIGGGAVALFLLIALHPLVELFPATSVASDVATGIAAQGGTGWLWENAFWMAAEASASDGLT